MPTAIDIVFLVALTVVGNAYDAWVEVPRWRARVAAGGPDPRVGIYHALMAWEWGLSALAVALWVFERHPWGPLRLGVPSGWRLVGAVGITIVMTALIIMQVRTILARRRAGKLTPERIERLRARTHNASVLIPHSRREWQWFLPVSVTAGLCEEWLYRGVVLALLAAWVGTPAAVVLSSIAFGFGHAYQGAKGVVSVSILGVVMALIVVATGSLLPAMFVHAAIDIGSGTTYFSIFSAPEAAPAPAA